MHLPAITSFILLSVSFAYALPVVQLFKPVESASISSRQFSNPICNDSGLDPSLCIDDREVPTAAEFVERQFPNPICNDSGLDPSLCEDD